MMVPRSFQYGAVTSKTRQFDEKESRRKNSYNTIISARIPAKSAAATTAVDNLPRTPTSATRHPNAQSRSATEPLAIPSVSSDSSMFCRSNKVRQRSVVTSNTHQPDALSPSVAALLAMTAIPPMKPHQTRRRKPSNTSHMSIDELVSSWRNDSSLRPSVSSSPSMSLLLEDIDDSEMEDMQSGKVSMHESQLLRTRSTSTDSIPSLDADDQSLLSVQSPSTPASLRSRKSNNNLRREKFKSSSVGEDCVLDHPLIFRSSMDEHQPQAIDTFSHTKVSPTAKTKSSFRSNLTTSLQALKNVALSSLTFKASSTPDDISKRQSSLNGGLVDDALWSHPYLFPRLSSEIRPAISGTPTQAQRRYLNPMPLTFEEQEAPFQQALHAPYLAQSSRDGPAIQLQTYTRGRKKVNKPRARSPDPHSEAGLAQSLASGIRQREPRENGDFLRVVVLEMNMRRAGKLETGKAKIWLPPRQVMLDKGEGHSKGRVPARWVGICA